MQSGLQRNSARFTPKYANNARILRLFQTIRTAENGLLGTEMRSLSWLFSGRHIRSPVSSRDLGQYNAIRSRGFGRSELTCVAILETDFGASHKPVFGAQDEGPKRCRITSQSTSIPDLEIRITTVDRIQKPYFWSFSLASAFPTAWAFAPRISARNGWAAAGAGTLPNSKARVVTLRP
jgi:hypothetical protein